MMISLSRRLAFLAMPKTGSTAVEAVLLPRTDIHFTGDPRVKHMPFRRYSRFVEPLLEAYGARGVETVALIREPCDWLLSWYRYRRRPTLTDPRHSTRDIGFEAFVEACLSPEPPPFAAVGRPSRFLAGRDGRPGVTHLFRYEDFPAFAAFLSERFGERLEFPRRNASPAEDVPVAAALRARIADGMAEEVRIWTAAGR